jgi:hypothetical protein
MVFEFNENHPWVLAHDSRNHDLRDMGEVEYRSDRPILEGKAVRRNCYLAKSRHWEYENELRLVRTSSDRELDTQSLAPFPASLLVSITIGANVDSKTYGNVAEILNGSPALAHVRLYQGELHLDEYRVTRSLYRG